MSVNINRIFKPFRSYYLRTYHGHYFHAKKIFVFDLLLLCSTFLLIGLVIFLKTFQPTIQQQVALSVSFPKERIISGRPIQIHVSYANASQVPIEQATLSLRIPKTLLIQDIQPSFPFNRKINSISIGSLPPKSTRDITIYAVYWGEPNTSNRLIATLQYQQSHRRVPEQVFTEVSIVANESILRVSMDTEEKRIIHQLLPVQVTLTNTGEEVVHDVYLSLLSPDSFSIIDSLPTISSLGWTSIQLEPGESKTFSITLKKINQEGTSVLQALSGVTIQGEQLIQDRTKKEVTYTASGITADLRIDFEKNQTHLEPGKKYPLILQLHNTGPFDIRDIEIEVPIDARIIESPVGSIRWKYTSDNHLSVLPKKESQTHTSSIFLHSFIDPEKFEQKDILLSLEPLVSFTIPEEQKERITFPSAIKKIPVTTSLLFSPHAFYFSPEGDQVGRGPLPPFVGAKTTYWINWELTNGTSDMQDVTIQGKLPEGVEWTGHTSVPFGNAVQYDPRTRSVVWVGERIPYHTSFSLFFEITVLPTPKQRGKEILLIEDMRLVGTDSFTGVHIEKTAPTITTNLFSDLFAKKFGSKVKGF